MNIAICDDEQIFLDKIKELLEKYSVTITANHANYHTIFLLSCLPLTCLRLLNPNFMI